MMILDIFNNARKYDLIRVSDKRFALQRSMQCIKYKYELHIL